MADSDPLLLLRQSLASKQPFHPTSDPDASSPSVPLAKATHLAFPSQSITLPITTPTRFVSNDIPVDLRSIYFAWLNRELPIPEYNAAAVTLNDELGADVDKKVQNLGFIEKLDLLTWLDGGSEEGDFIKPLAEGAAKESVAAKTGAQAQASQKSGKGSLDPRLASVYSGERKMGDRNTVLRGIKPTDFTHVRKFAATFLSKKAQPPTASNHQNLALNQKTQTRRPDPIILLSPSASALLRLSNARSFLGEGKFVPPETDATTTNMLHITRSMPNIDPTRPLRFILVEGPEQFKPEYWNRVVAVFTTGQTWQFKNYKWSNPNELFKHVLGVYVGWRGEQRPDNVAGWGHRVYSRELDRWMGAGLESSRFRDKEVVEGIWKEIERNMGFKGWRKDAAPSSI